MKKTNGFLRIAALAAALLSAPALGQGVDHSGFHFGGGLGHANATDACRAGTPCGEGGTAYHIFAGWHFNRALAVEVGFHDLGTSQSLGADFDSMAVDLTVLAGIPVGPVFLYGRGGVFRGEVSTGSLNDSNVNWTFGGGVQIDLSHRFALRAEWQRYRELGATNIGFKSDIDKISAAIVFKFR